jgi:hypothetical protein
MYQLKLPARVRDFRLLSVSIKTTALLVITLSLLLATASFAVAAAFDARDLGQRQFVTTVKAGNGNNGQVIYHKDKEFKHHDSDKEEIHGAEMTPTALLLAGLFATAGYLLIIRRRRVPTRS